MSSKQFLYIAIATFITIMVWLVLGFIHAGNTSSVSPDISKVEEPISPDFDKEVLNALGG